MSVSLPKPLEVHLVMGPNQNVVDQLSRSETVSLLSLLSEDRLRNVGWVIEEDKSSRPGMPPHTGLE